MKKLTKLINKLIKRVDFLSNKIDKIYEDKAICIIGVGGGGCNIVDDIAKLDNSFNIIHINSDINALNTKYSGNKIVLGRDIKRGFGCGGQVSCGRKLFDEKIKKELLNLIKNNEKIYLVSTLGGGVGSGVIPEILKYLQYIGKDVKVIVTIPFSFEGKKRKTNAYNSIQDIEKISHEKTNIRVLKNDDLIKKAIDEELSVKETFLLTSSIIFKMIEKI
ncbi:MAG: hypothetical protein WC141_01585 [Arcobacteraceae bacterium]